MTTVSGDFESFVREEFARARDHDEKVATAILDLIPRVGDLEFNEKKQDKLLSSHDVTLDKHTRQLARHSEQIQNHERALTERARVPNSIPPLPRPANKSGSFTPEQIEEAWEKIGVDFAAMRTELAELKKEKEFQERLASKAKEEQDKAEKSSARLRGWLALVVSILLLLGGLFAYLSPRLGAPVKDGQTSSGH